MLVGLYNVVKVESVPLNSDEFRDSPQGPLGPTVDPSARHTVPMRFNPPPNWPPAPPGWVPPPNWQPDPSWPPPPPGWQLWVPDHSPAGRTKTPLIVGGIAVAIVVLVAVVLTVVLVSRSDSGDGSGPSTTATASSDEDQIADQVDAFEKAWNDEDFDAMESIVCSELQDDPEFTEEEFLSSRQESGRLSLTVLETDVTGDKAVVSIEQQGESANDFDFVREGDEWKWCEL